MPREIIQTPVGPYYVKVGWERDRGVQIGVEAEGERSLFWMLLGSYKEQLGEEIRRLVDYARANLPEPQDGTTQRENDAKLAEGLLNALDVLTPLYRGVWSDLDRHGCNDLIRVVRRARDQAYGRDE